MSKKLELLKFGGHIGVYDPILKKRLKDLMPKKFVSMKIKASAFEGGHATLSLGDIQNIQKKLRNKRLKILLAKYGTIRI
jgi:hypothetical protein